MFIYYNAIHRWHWYVKLTANEVAGSSIKWPLVCLYVRTHIFPQSQNLAYWKLKAELLLSQFSYSATIRSDFAPQQAIRNNARVDVHRACCKPLAWNCNNVHIHPPPQQQRALTRILKLTMLWVSGMTDNAVRLVLLSHWLMRRSWNLSRSRIINWPVLWLKAVISITYHIQDHGQRQLSAAKSMHFSSRRWPHGALLAGCWFNAHLFFIK